MFIVLLCDSIKIGQALCSATVQRQQRRNINVWSDRETSTAGSGVGSGVGSGIVKGEDGTGVGDCERNVRVITTGQSEP